MVYVLAIAVMLGAGLYVALLAVSTIRKVRANLARISAASERLNEAAATLETVTPRER